MLKIKDLKKNYDGFRLDVSLEVKPGTITGLVGRNGSGKSTTFKAILGLIDIDGGSIEYQGNQIHGLTSEQKETMGVVLAEALFSNYQKKISGL